MNLSAIITMAFLASAGVAEAICHKNKKRRTPTLTLTACALLTLCLIAQLRFPWLLPLLERNTTQVLHGQWWRLVVALFFIGNLVEQIRTRQDWLLISLIGALLAECFGLWWQPRGAGNSIATCSLAGYLLVARSPAPVPAVSRILRIIAGVCSVLLILARDVHGAAATAGLVFGVLRAGRQQDE